MSNAGENSDDLAKVLVKIPKNYILKFKEIMKLVSPEHQTLVADVLHLVPNELLLSILDLEPSSTIQIIECIEPGGTHVRYGCFTKTRLIPKCLKNINWKEIMGPLRDQSKHDVCWAIVVSELIRAVRLIEKRELDNMIRYSPQDLIDFVDKDERKIVKKENHYCYTSNLTNGYKYVMNDGIQLEEDRPFVGCPKDFDRVRASTRFGFIKDFVKLSNIEYALRDLEHRPIGAALAIFHPEYTEIGKKIYRGPAVPESSFMGMHAVSLMSVGKENGEKYVLARSSHGNKFGDDGYIKISLEVMIVHIPTPGETTLTNVEDYFSKPCPLLRRFSYPTLLTEKEEKIKRKIHQDKEKIG